MRRLLRQVPAERGMRGPILRTAWRMRQVTELRARSARLPSRRGSVRRGRAPAPAHRPAVELAPEPVGAADVVHVLRLGDLLLQVADRALIAARAVIVEHGVAAKLCSARARRGRGNGLLRPAAPAGGGYRAGPSCRGACAGCPRTRAPSRFPRRASSDRSGARDGGRLRPGRGQRRPTAEALDQKRACPLPAG